MFSLPAVLAFWLPLVLVGYNWLFFPLVLFLLVKMKGRKRITESTDWELPFVSIVIAAHNEQDTIRQKLENCLSLDYPADKLDIVVVSDGSDDNTDSIVQEFLIRGVRLLRQETRRGKAAALNLAMRELKGDLVLFTDADVLIDPLALRTMVDRFKDRAVGVVHAHYRRLNQQGNPAEGLFDRYEAALKNLEGKVGAMVGAYGWSLMLRRELCQPIPEDTILDDFLLGIRPFRAGFAVVYEQGAFCWTRTEEEKVEFGRKVRISRGNVQAFSRCLDLFHPRYGVKAWVLFSHKFLRWITPFLLISIFISSAVLADYVFFRAVFLMQLVVYLTIPFLFIVPRRIRRFMFPQYYLLQNLALVVGYWQYLFRKSTSPWQRTSRGG